MEEFLKLDTVDQKVLVWLINHSKTRTIKSWLEYTIADYKRRKALTIDGLKIYQEIQEFDV